MTETIGQDDRSETVDEALSRGVWLIALCPNSKYIGRVYGDLDHENEELRNQLEHTIIHGLGREHISLEWAQEFSCTIIPANVQTPQGMQLMLRRNVEALPISRCLDIDRLVIHVVPTEVIFFSDMSPHDRNWHKGLVAAGQNNIIRQRMEAANIAHPNAGAPAWSKDMSSGNA